MRFAMLALYAMMLCTFVDGQRIKSGANHRYGVGQVWLGMDSDIFMRLNRDADTSGVTDSQLLTFANVKVNDTTFDVHFEEGAVSEIYTSFEYGEYERYVKAISRKYGPPHKSWVDSAPSSYGGTFRFRHVLWLQKNGDSISITEPYPIRFGGLTISKKKVPKDLTF